MLKEGEDLATRPKNSAPSATFVIYDMGCVFIVGHLTHFWVRSDRYYHGTIADADIDNDTDFLVGTALANNRYVTANCLHTLSCDGLVTWQRQYDIEEPANTYIRGYGRKP